MFWRIVKRPWGLLILGLLWFVISAATSVGAPTCGGQDMAPGQVCMRNGSPKTYEEMASRSDTTSTIGMGIGGAMTIGGVAWLVARRQGRSTPVRGAPGGAGWPPAGPAPHPGAPALPPHGDGAPAPYGIHLPPTAPATWNPPPPPG